MPSEQTWLLPHAIGATDLVERFYGPLRPALALDSRRRMTLYDTFVGQLWRQRMLLCKLDEIGALCQVERLSRDEAIAVCQLDGDVPKFWWEFPDGPLRESLCALIGVRALVPLAEVIVVTQRIDFRNEDDKTVARVIVQRYVPAGEPAEPSDGDVGVCRMVPIRGYDGETALVQAALQAWGFPPCETAPVELILEQCGRRPERPTAEPKWTLAPSMTVREAIGRLSASSLETSRRWEAGVIDDVDTEFLHDYRVGLRRVRSALKLIKHVYPPEATAQAADDLAQCARRTNRLRDLDVFLINRDDLLRCTPPDLTGAGRNARRSQPRTGAGTAPRGGASAYGRIPDHHRAGDRHVR